MDYKPLTNWDARPSRLTYIYKVFFFPVSEIAQSLMILTR